MASHNYSSDPDALVSVTTGKEAENEAFAVWLKQQDLPAAELDAQVHNVYARVEAGIDCTQCGNCCNTLIIDVSATEIARCAGAMSLSDTEFKDRYVEESQQGRCFINKIPCHFFADRKCTIYDLRFEDCRQFPHLHKPGFLDRLQGTLQHYGRCPIIYYTIEELKGASGFQSS
jgi:uncharacterized protein